MKKIVKLTAVLLLMASTHSFAGIINGGFESGLASWTTTGGVTTTSSAISGSTSAYINQSTLGLSALDTFFGLSSNTFANTLDCSDEPCTAGSGFYQSISYQAGDVLSFDWISTLENSSSYVDWVAFVVEDMLIQLGNGIDTANNTLFNTEYTFLTSGTSLLGFVVGDGGDSCCGSTMKVDNVELVPEPSILALMGAGLVVGLGFARRRKQQT